MVDKYIKRIWLTCLCLTSLSLVGCFHVPDEDWLPSRNKVETTQKDDQIEQALNSFIEWIDIVSSRQNERKSELQNEDEINQDEAIIEESKDETVEEEPTDWKAEDIITEE